MAPPGLRPSIIRATHQRAAQRLKTTTIYVTHDQIEAMSMGDKILVMHDGVVEQIGSPLNLYENSLTTS